jgi:23S rRNA (guanosine2251-2'-O)-methyltransferase
VRLLNHGEKERFFYKIKINKLKDNSLQYVFGIHPVTEAINSGREVNKVYIRKGLKNEPFNELFQKIRELSIPFQFVPNEKLNSLTGRNHQGIIAELSSIEYKNLEEIIQRTYEEGRDPFIIVLDRITDVRNFGAIARTAECAGVDAIVVPEKGSVTVTPDAIKTSAGALNRVAVCRKKDLVETVAYLKESGISIAAATEKARYDYFNTDLRGPVALIMGSEESGISKPLLEISEKLIRIPMAGSIESLNVSVACGIIAFEIVRQRKIS